MVAQQIMSLEFRRSDYKFLEFRMRYLTYLLIIVYMCVALPIGKVITSATRVLPPLFKSIAETGVASHFSNRILI